MRAAGLVIGRCAPATPGWRGSARAVRSDRERCDWEPVACADVAGGSRDRKRWSSLVLAAMVHGVGPLGGSGPGPVSQWLNPYRPDCRTAAARCLLGGQAYKQTNKDDGWMNTRPALLFPFVILGDPISALSCHYPAVILAFFQGQITSPKPPFFPSFRSPTVHRRSKHGISATNPPAALKPLPPRCGREALFKTTLDVVRHLS